MSFLKIFKKVEHVASVAANVVGPVVSIFNPAAGALVQMIGGSVLKAEANITAPKSGPQKREMATQDVMNMLMIAFAIAGKPFPENGKEQIEVAIDSIVNALNAVNQLSGDKD